MRLGCSYLVRRLLEALSALSAVVALSLPSQIDSHADSLILSTITSILHLSSNILLSLLISMFVLLFTASGASASPHLSLSSRLLSQYYCPSLEICSDELWLCIVSAY